MSSGNSPEEVGAATSGKLSSKKGKRSCKQGKAARQPQRGLGVAELEKMRIQTETNHQLHASDHSINSLNIQSNLNYMMVHGENETISGHRNINNDQHNNPMYRNVISPYHNAATSSSAILPLFAAQPAEDSTQKKRRHDLGHSNVIGPIYNSGTNEDPQELDLDLKLSIL